MPAPKSPSSIPPGNDPNPLPEVSISTRYRLSLVREPSPDYAKPVCCARPAEAAKFVQQLLADRDREVVGAILLQQPHHAIGHVIAYIGTLARTTVEPRGLLVPALLANAFGIILFHNHPSSHVTPSPEDIAFCKRLNTAADILGLLLVDSLIVGPDGPWISMRQLGLFPPPNE